MANFLKKGDERLNAGQFDQLGLFFAPVQTKDGAGGEVRTPSIRDVSHATPVYQAWCNVAPYQGMLTEQDQRLIAETWSLVSIRYHRSRLPVQGMLLQVKLTGDVYEIRGVDHVNFNRKKVELTCRLLD